MDIVPPILFGDPAYPLLSYFMTEISSCQSDEDVLFNTMLCSARNQIECAFGRLKAQWKILIRASDVDIKLVPSLIHTCFILHNFCESRNILPPPPPTHTYTYKKVQFVANKKRIRKKDKNIISNSKCSSLKRMTATMGAVNEITTTVSILILCIVVL